MGLMIIDVISDLHGFYPKLEGGDLLIVAGDLTHADTEDQMYEFYSWLDDQTHKYKVFIGGNHDNRLQKKGSDYFLDREDEAVYLCDSGTEFEYYDEPEHDPDLKTWLDNVHTDRKKKLRIWGSPWTKRFEGMNPQCMAFTVDTEEELAEKWALIPDDVDMLVTHSPPHGCYLDQDRKGRMLGSVSLRDRIWKLNLKLHVFGHIHEGYGTHPIIGKPIHVNASHVNERYQPVNNPIRIEL